MQSGPKKIIFIFLISKKYHFDKCEFVQLTVIQEGKFEPGLLVEHVDPRVHVEEDLH